METGKKRWALISVSDKTGIVEFVRGLIALGLSILSTGGTAKLLEKSGIAVTEVSTHTGFPEMLDGRLKTLHPKIHGALLARRDSTEHMEAIRAAGIEPIDLLVVNLYPFAATVAKPNCTFEEAIENIDIGGPTMLRAAAKNHTGVVVVCDPKDYNVLLMEMRDNGGVISPETRLLLAKKVFAHTAAYDATISAYLSGVVHILEAGFALCRFMERPPKDWPTGHSFVGIRCKDKATCPGCQAVARYLQG